MKSLKHILVLAGMGAALCLSGPQLFAQERQGRGNFDPEEFRQRIMERYREQLGVKDDAEWKVLETRIAAVMEARREVGVGGRGFGGPPRGRGGDRGDRGGDDRRRFGGEPSPEVEALEKAIEADASAEEIKSKLAAYRQAREAKEAKLEKARQELRQVLSVKQEANAVLMGLLE